MLDLNRAAGQLSRDFCNTEEPGGHVAAINSIRGILGEPFERPSEDDARLFQSRVNESLSFRWKDGMNTVQSSAYHHKDKAGGYWNWTDVEIFPSDLDPEELK